MNKKITSFMLAALMLFSAFFTNFTNVLAADGAENYPLNSIVIKIEDAVTHSMLVGARFEIYYNNQAQSGGYGTLVATVDSDASGVIVISGLPSGYYIVRQTVPPNNYHLSINNEQHCYIKPDATSIEELVFSNYRYGGLAVILNDKDTGKPIANATFSVTDVENKSVGTSADGIYMTDSKGEFYLENLPAGDYKITQLTAAQGYAMDSSPNSRTVRLQHTNADQSVFRATFENSPLGSLLVRVKDSVSKEPLPGAKFNVKASGGADLGEFTTNAGGTFLLPKIAKGSYIITQISAPVGYLTANAKTQFVDYVNTYAVDFENSPQSGLYILKIDADTKVPLKDAKFNIYKDATIIGAYTTNADGAITIANLEPGWYTVSEYQAPQGYVLDDTPQNLQVISSKLHKLTFEDKKLASLQIIKTDEYDGTPLSGAKFRVTTQNGEFVADVTTDLNGKATVPNVVPGWYVISETKAPAGYIITETARTVEVKATVPTVVTITNRAENNLEILKLDAYTRKPLTGATFKVEHSDGEHVGTYNTDSAGKILIGSLKEGTYVISEIKAPNGYQLDSEPQTIVIEGGKLQSVEFLDKPLTAIEIIKMDSVTKLPLAGATFKVERPNGEVIGTYKTDVSGKALVSDIESGTYIISETIAPDGYILHETPKTVTVISNKVTTVEFTNKPYSGIQIIKTDSVTHTPLSNATFKVESPNGEVIGTYKTDVSGKALISDLAEGTYIVSETIAPTGYILSEIPKTVVVKSGKLTTVEFTNKALTGLKIIKLNAVTKSPIEGVEFTIAKISGEKVQNDFRGNTFVTDRTGQIYINNLEDGYYSVTETKAAEGYLIDGEPKTVEIISGKPTVLEVLNQPASGLLIVKRDENTGKPLKGVVFDIKKANGERVTSSLFDGNQPNTENNSPNKSTTPNGDISGSYTTDANGRILINILAPGEYNVTETKALPGYILDTDVHSVTIVPGKQAVLQLTNKPMAGLRLLKIDSITKKPIYGVEFMLFDANNKVVGTYYTDNNGVIDFSTIVTEGRYTIRETRAAKGYYLDETPKTVEFVAGKVTEIVWTNTPQMGQIQILKKSGDDNEVNGLPAGTPLEGAVFEIYAYKSGNLIDRFVSGSDGKAVSSPLPIGRYLVKEVQPPKYYKLSDKQLDIEIEFATQIIKHEFLNYSANTGVYIKKTGNVEAMPGNTIRYDIKAVQNTGSVPLSDFFWRDVLPVDAVRINKIITGTYNQSLKYKIVATTNKGDTKIIADNLSTTKNNSIDCSNASLGLGNDEFVTSFSFYFGTVKAGFAQVETPQVYVNVLKTLPNGYQFANKCDVGGKYGGEWIIGNSTCVTKIYSNSKLPKTGY